jgi:geranylgeranyl diphosphate synthase type I
MSDPTEHLQKHDSLQTEMMEEMCLLVDKDDKMIGEMSKLDCHYGEGRRHRAFSVIIINNKGEMLVQQRSQEKITFPGVWANACCSHPLNNDEENGGGVESVISAARRKLEHELGIPISESEKWNFDLLGRFEYECRWDDNWIEKEIDHVLLVKCDVNVNINKNEIEIVKWLNKDQLYEMVNREGNWSNEFIAPWFIMIWNHFLSENYPNINAIKGKHNAEIINCGKLYIDREKPGSGLMDALKVHKSKVEHEIMFSLSKMEQKRLHGAMTHLFSGGGKRLRAILPRLVGEAIGNANDGHYTLGACIEIIHNFTLVHDDIIDQDPIRRGLDAVHVAYDDATAINAGDAMLAVGFEILAESSEISGDNLRYLVKAIGEMVRKVAEGQQEDIEFENRESVSEEEYIAMIAGKTSAMFETCARTGAILSGASKDTVSNMAKWGLNLGLCFQLMDDLIDITGDTKTLGKPAGSDIIQGKRTLIAIHALESKINLSDFHKVFGNGPCSKEALESAINNLHVSGSIDYAKKRAMYHHSLAHECLNYLDNCPEVEVLRELTDFQLIRIN